MARKDINFNTYIERDLQKTTDVRWFKEWVLYPLLFVLSVAIICRCEYLEGIKELKTAKI